MSDLPDRRDCEDGHEAAEDEGDEDFGGESHLLIRAVVSRRRLCESQVEV
jgi:hypothetical protein